MHTHLDAIALKVTQQTILVVLVRGHTIGALQGVGGSEDLAAVRGISQAFHVGSETGVEHNLTRTTIGGPKRVALKCRAIADNQAGRNTSVVGLVACKVLLHRYIKTKKKVYDK